MAVLDVDPRNGGDLALEDLEQSYGSLPDTAVALSGSKGPHHYFALDGPLGKFDPGPGLNLQADGALVVAPPSLHHSGNRYEWEASSHPADVALAPLPDWLRAMGEAKASTPVQGVDLPDTLPPVDIQALKVSHRIKYLIAMGHDPDDPARYCYPNGTPDRSRALFAVIQGLLSVGHDDATIASVVMDPRYAISTKVLSQKNARNPRYWEQVKAWVAKEIARAKAKQPPTLVSRGRATAQTETSEEDNALNTFLASAPWPEIGDEAFYGLAGKIVHTIAPHTEADPLAILIQFLTMFGSLVGRTPYFPAEADRHYLNLFVCLVGETSKGRKGVSAGYPKRLLETVDDVWTQSRIMSGLSSGEGLIWYVRDPNYKPGKDGEEQCIDEGEQDKRLLVLEPEFARVLRVLARDGNTLSAVIRHAWDDGTLQTMVSGRRVASVKATDAHISIIGHITVDELRRNLTETETSNGFANRFLWCCVRRARLLPEGGMYPTAALQPFRDQLTTAVIAARKTGRMERDAAARTRWAAIYEALSEGKPGLLGHVTARAEAQVLRLSSLYALLDQSPIVQVSHLDGALALWKYAEASAAYIFSDALGDALADEILQMLRACAPDGMTRTDLYNAFGRNKKSTTIQQALAGLWRHQLVTYTTEATAGRPIERWYARLSASSSTQKTHLTQKGNAPTCGPQEQTPLNTFNAFNASMQGENGTQGGATSPCAHARPGEQAGQTVCLACGELLEVAAPAPAFDELTASALWCPTCGVAVRFRTLPQLDGGEVYLCHLCDTEVGHKRTTAPPSRNGTHAPADVPLAAQPVSVDEDDYDEGVIV